MKNEPIFRLWRNKGKNNKLYFAGVDNAGNKLVGFYGNLKNEKAPAIKVYDRAVLERTPADQYPAEMFSLWTRRSKAGKLYLTGKYGDSWLVGFVNDKATDENRQPYLNVYEQEPAEQQVEPPKKARATRKPAAVSPVQAVPDDDGDLPF